MRTVTDKKYGAHLHAWQTSKNYDRVFNDTTYKSKNIVSSNKHRCAICL